jgi:cytoskeletal protein CcmA (bactofilin family)
MAYLKTNKNRENYVPDYCTTNSNCLVSQGGNSISLSLSDGDIPVLQAFNSSGSPVPLAINTGLIVKGGDPTKNALVVDGGNTLINRGMNVGGDVNLAKNLNVVGNSTLSNNLNVVGNTSLSKDLNVLGNTSLSKDLNVTGNVGLNGTTSSNGLISTKQLNVVNNNGTVTHFNYSGQSQNYIRGNLQIDGNTNVGPSLSVGQNISVGGQSNLGSIQINGRTIKSTEQNPPYIPGDLSIAGTYFGNSLNTSGSLTTNGDIFIQGRQIRMRDGQFLQYRCTDIATNGGYAC